jgi:hypothetical protein
MHKNQYAADIQETHRLGWFALAALIAILLPSPLFAKTVVFWQPGFPTFSSQPVERDALERALDGLDPQFLDLESLSDPAALKDTDLLVLPYGSAVPTDAWKAIEGYLHAGGNLLVVGGQPLHVPVSQADGKFVAAFPQDTYARSL